jgi:hypothetical protein
MMGGTLSFTNLAVAFLVVCESALYVNSIEHRICFLHSTLLYYNLTHSLDSSTLRLG